MEQRTWTLSTAHISESDSFRNSIFITSYLKGAFVNDTVVLVGWFPVWGIIAENCVCVCRNILPEYLFPFHSQLVTTEGVVNE